jgi:hypothetical protein
MNLKNVVRRRNSQSENGAKEKKNISMLNERKDGEQKAKSLCKTRAFHV